MRFILVMSGKGGVGKSTCAANLAREIAAEKGKCGLLDLDLTGPSIPTLFGIQSSSVKNHNGKMVPVCVDGVEIISLGLMLGSKDEAVIWRGPRKNGMIQSFFSMIEWSTDTVVIDFPPGTSDEHLSTISILRQNRQEFKAIVVTTPSPLAMADVRKCLDMCRKVGVPVVGSIENFSGVMCPCCGEITRAFGDSPGDKLPIPVLCKIPFYPEVAAASDLGKRGELILPLFKPIIEKINL